GETIDDAVIRNEANDLRPRMREAMPEADPIALESRVREWARENVIERVLLRQAAMSDPEPIAAEVLDGAVNRLRTETPGQSGCILPGGPEALRADVEAQMRLERLTTRLTGRLSPPRNKDITEYYRKHRDHFFAPEVVHAAHIVKNADENATEEAALETMRGVQRELKQGADFAELADRYSDCPGRGGDLGFFGRGQMVEEFDNVIFALPPGELSDIFRTPFGFHIAKVYEKKPEGIRPLEEVRDNIQAMLFNEKKQKMLEQYIDHLRAKAEVL
ncbi:MAG: peptidylprolyl isomerase, partial [Bryobacteraceae bacterium]